MRRLARSPLMLREQLAEVLLDQYGPVLWSNLSSATPSSEQTESEFLSVFVRIAEAIPKFPQESIRQRVEKMLWNSEAPLAGLQQPTGEELPPPPLAIRNLTLQQMRAAIVRAEAMRRQRGPIWTPLALLLVTLLGGAFVAVGVHLEGPTPAPIPSSPGTSAGSPKINPPWTSSPLRLVALYSLEDVDWRRFHLQKAVVADGKLVIPKLNLPADNWPNLSLSEAPLAVTGSSLPSSLSSTQVIDFIPPSTASVELSKADRTWSISSWSLYATANWLVAEVNWEQAHAPLQPHLTQIYLENIRSGQSSLYRTYSSLSARDTKQTHYTFAVGAGRFVVQSAVAQKPGQTPVPLPIQVYRFDGSDPLHALQHVGQLPGSFGLMSHPAATPQGLIFDKVSDSGQKQGGQAKPNWTLLSWNGLVEPLMAPPTDGAMHSVLYDQKGDLWWVERNLVSPSRSQYGVVLGHLESADASNPSGRTYNLSGQVTFFHAMRKYVLWIQGRTSDDQELAVEEVQGVSSKT
ncbi:MAG: hypothetical protein OWQ59_10405 [Alicyclobacillaceae bacterium]|nr:hypothetical protein [Alicyclobacillaceae bacterium]